MKSFKRIIALTSRNIKEIIRDPLSLMFLYLFPVAMLIIFYLLFHNLTAQFGMKYLAPGMVVFSQAFITLFVGMLIAKDRESSFIIRLYTTEIKAYEFILSYMLSCIPIVLTQSTIILVVGGLFDLAFFSWYFIAAIFLSLITSLLFVTLGILFGSICSEQSVGGISSMVVMLQSILSGMWFPLNGLSPTFVKILDILPFKNGAFIIQNSLDGIYNFQDMTLHIFIVLGYALIIFLISVRLYKHKMTK